MRRRALAGFAVAAWAFAARAGSADSRHPGIELHESLGFRVSNASTVCAGGPTLEGIDVSHWDGAIDWPKVAASGRRFGIAKATEGLSFQDPVFQAHWTAM